MSDSKTTSSLDDKLKKVMAETEGGARNPSGAIPKKVLFFVPLLWTLFQLWYSSPLPYLFNIFVLNDTQARSIHLAFAMFLAFTAFPTFKRSPSTYIPIQDWIVAFIAAFCAGYLYLFYAELAWRPGSPTTLDLVVAVVGLVLLLEATRRALGPPLMVVGAIFMIYAFGGQSMPDIIAHQGASLAKGMSHYWLGTEGVFGVALGVSTGMVFMFVLFGALLEKAGAGNYFIRTSFAALGHFRGGPAKAAVVSSGMTGIVSGSSIANVVTTGTFTIPLMKKVGFKPEKAGAIEVACSTNGQLMPPVMGAAAFLMVEYVGISYIEVIKHAFLPAIISYIALLYIVHLEACKMGLEGMKRPVTTSFMQKVFSFATVIVLLLVIAAATYYGLGWIKTFAGDGAFWIVLVLLLAAYLFLLWIACKVPELELTTEIKELPPLKETAQAGYYFLLPVVVLMWCLVVERLSPALSAYWATMLMIFILLTQRPIKGFYRKAKGVDYAVMTGATELINGLVAGARNMIGIGVATAAAGIVVGTVTLTGIGLVMTEFVEFISGGSLMLVLIFTAIISLLLGMGLPTTANYIVVSTLMAPVVVELGAANGLIVPLIAVHLFVFYFGILADDTPPVGLAAFAAAGISGGDPIRTGIQGFTYDMRTAILPFMFIFNNQLLLIGLTGWFHLLIVITTAMIGMLCFASATQGYMLTRNRKWESVILLVIAIGLFRPGIVWDRFYPPLIEEPPSELAIWIGDMEPGEALRLTLQGERLSGREYVKAIMLTVGGEPTGEERMAALGIETIEIDGRIFVDMVTFGSPAARAGMTFDEEILNFQVPTNRPPKELMYIPILAVLAGVWTLQFRRRKKKLATG